MRLKHAVSLTKAVPAPAADDLQDKIRRGVRRQRVFSWIVLVLLVTAFIVTSALQAMPLLFRTEGK